MTAPIRIDDADGVRVVTWERADALNAMSLDMWDGTRDALDSAVADGIRVHRPDRIGPRVQRRPGPRRDGRPAPGRRDPRLPGCDACAAGGPGPAHRSGQRPRRGVRRHRPAVVRLRARLRRGPLPGSVRLLGGDDRGRQQRDLARGDGSTGRGALRAHWRLAVRGGCSGARASCGGWSPGTRSSTRPSPSRFGWPAAPPESLRTTTGLLRHERRARWAEAMERENAAFARLAGSEENLAAIERFFSRKGDR